MEAKVKVDPGGSLLVFDSWYIALHVYLDEENLTIFQMTTCLLKYKKLLHLFSFQTDCMFTYVTKNYPSFQLLISSVQLLLAYMLQDCIIKTMSSFFDTFSQMPNVILTQGLCRIYGVQHVARYPLEMSREDKAEFFLLGATFTSVEIQNHTYNVMIHNDTMHILSVEP